MKTALHDHLLDVLKVEVEHICATWLVVFAISSVTLACVQQVSRSPNTESTVAQTCCLVILCLNPMLAYT